MEKLYRILAINPGSTSTKVAYYENEKKIDEKNLDVPREATAKMTSIMEQYDMRRQSIDRYFEELGVSKKELDIIVARGAGGGNLKAGGYLINAAYVEHCRAQVQKIPHASCLSPIIAYEWMTELGIPGYIYDAVGVNEFNRYALLSGIREFPVQPGAHTLNAKAAARKAAVQMGGKYADFNMVVCHMGGGVSTSAHDHGRLVDSVADAYAPERSGGLPMSVMNAYTRACFSGEYTLSQMLKFLMGGGGLVSYLGTSDVIEVERRMEAGDSDAAYYYNGMVYHLARDIGAMATVMDCNVDAVVLTGGMAHSKTLTGRLTEKVKKLAPVIVVPGSNEMEALALGALRCARGEEPTHIFGEK